MRIQNPHIQPGQKHVVIIGAGFAGLSAAKALAHRSPVQVTLFDQRNHHLFQPLLYQVATAALNPADIAVPIRSEFAKVRNVAVHLGRVDTVNLREQWVGGGKDVRVGFDYLLVACGAQHSYFGRDEWEEFAPGLKTLEQATEIRRRILLAFELAENEFDPERQEMLLTFVVVGGGPTGVELAGAIADISRTVLVRDFKRIDPARAKVLLLEAGPRILPQFKEQLSEHSVRDLTQLGVEVRTSTLVTKIDGQGVDAARRRIPSRSVFWAAGVQAGGLSRTLGVELDHTGRIVVGPDLAIPGHPNAFVAGDIAHLELGDGKLLPGLAPAAIQTGQLAAHNILASIASQPRSPFRYVDKGQMATIGKHKAVAQVGRFAFTGYIAWLTWLFVHIVYLIGFRNRVAVLAQWAWSYLFSKRGARLITQKEWKLNP
ncbi:MAG: NAD(P)/FAD-dependent oxidoreductase [SAR324 cluster bacterium]